jgi:TonB-dependent SusC/RagA subfamily outer membrane receptor
VRRLGYVPAERSVIVSDGAIVTLDMALAPAPSRLEEVVTTVTGAQRRVEVGNVIGTINADSVMREAPVSSLTDMLNARVPGAQVVLNGGFTGSAPRVRIRGINSVAVGNDPLLVVDGVRVENSTGAAGGFGQTSGRLNDLSLDEIESIEIVKGPSAATLYGTDAANGVIVVRTKRGQVGATRGEFHVDQGRVDQPAQFPDNYYSWGHSSRTGAIQQCVIRQAAAQVCVIDSLTTLNPLMSEETSPFGVGNHRQYGARLSGGANRLTYLLSGEYEAEEGYLEMPRSERTRIMMERGGAAIPQEQRWPNRLRKVNLRSNATATIGSTSDVSVSLGLVKSNISIPGNLVFQSGIWGLGARDATNGWRFGQPGEAFAIRNAEDVTHVLGSVAAVARPSEWLSTRATLGMDFSSASLDGLQRTGEGPAIFGRDGRRMNTRTSLWLYTVDVGASASFQPRPNLSSRTSVGIQYNRRALAATTASGTGLLPGSETVAGAATASGAEQNVESVVAGSYLEETIGVAERLFATAAVRADGASAFGRDFRTVTYPKGSISWVAVPSRSGAVNDVRLRAAYGASGVQPPSTAALAMITYAPAIVDGVRTTGARVSAIGNSDLKPERQVELEGGVDATLLNQRVRIEATLYNRLSDDALVNRRLAPEVGIGSRLENIGAVRNSGYEGLASVMLVDLPALTWSVTVNGSINHNRLERLAAEVPFIGGNADFRSMEGYPLFSRFARPILSYTDANGNGIIEDNEVQVGDAVVFVGPSLPTRQVAFTNSIGMFSNRLRISMQFDHRGGHRVLNFAEYNRCSLRNCRALNDPTASLAEQARAVAATTPSLGNTLYGYMEDGAFTRWRELAVSFDLPGSVRKSVGARTANVTLTGRNLRLFTNYSGVDPEVNEVGFTEGYTNNPAAPPARYWMLRVNLGY